MPYVNVNGHQLHYTDIHATKPVNGMLTFIFIHGLGASENFFFPVLPYLTENHRCVTFDIYGSARSLFTGDVTTIDSIASDVCGVMDALHVPQAIVVGHSMGGIVANHLASKYKERVWGIVAVGPTHPEKGTSVNMENRKNTVTQAGMEPIASSVPENATGHKATSLQKAFLRELFISQNPQGYAAICHAVATAQAPDYRQITVPYLLIVGDDDKSATLDSCNKIFDNISSSYRKMEVLPGIGHWYCIEDPNGVGSLLSGFASELAGHHYM